MLSTIITLAFLTSHVLAESCSPVHYVFARPTAEEPVGITEQTTTEQWKVAAAKWWSQGYGEAGGALWLNLTDPKVDTKIPGITGYAVPYPANTTPISPQIGIQLIVAEIKQKSSTCLDQKYVLGGHSQGGGVVTGAIDILGRDLPKSAMDRIVAVTMFGSPACPATVKQRCRSYCNNGDFVCDPAAKSNTPNFGGSPAKGNNRRSLPRRVNFAAQISSEASSCSNEYPETGHEPTTGEKTGLGPHISYSSDGYYIRAAACFIQRLVNV